MEDLPQGRPRPRRPAPHAGADRARDNREEPRRRRPRPGRHSHPRRPAGGRLHTLVGELSGSEVPLGDIDISFYRDDIDGREPASAPVVHASHLDFDLEGRTVILVDDVLFTGRTARAAIEALFDYGRPAASSWRCWSTAATASFRSGPTTSARTCRPRARSASTSGWRNPTASTRWRSGNRSRPRPPRRERRTTMRHLLAVEGMERADIERILERAESFAEVGPARHQEGADPARPHRRQPLLRVEHPHELLVRAGGQATLSRRRLGQVGRLRGRQGRVAEGHDRDAQRLRAGGDHHPPPHAGAADLVTAGPTPP